MEPAHARWPRRAASRAALLAGPLAALLVAGSSRAATGGPDAFGYRWADQASGCSASPGSFGPGATIINGATTTQGPFALGFTMPYYGQPVSQAWVSPNGYLTFSAQGNGAPARCPTAAAPNHLIAAFWAASASANITVEATPGQFHVRWFQRIGLDDYDTHLFLQPNGDFRIHWVNNGTVVASVIMGYENATGTVGRTFMEQVNYAPVFVDGTFDVNYLGHAVCVTAPVLLDCSAPTVATCGAAVASVLPAMDPSPAALYSCSPSTFLGNEQVFRVDVAAAEAVTVSVSNPALSLFRVSAPPQCGESNCIGAYGTGATFPILVPGSYWFVVDKAAAGGGDAFDFSVACASPYTPISCGDSVSGTTAGATPSLPTHACSPPLSGPEALYLLDLPAQQTFAATLQTANPDLWVVIYTRSAFESGSTQCLAAGRGGSGAFDAPAGQYVVVVDGANGAAGAYTLDLDCGRRMDCTGATDISCSAVVSGTTAGVPNAVSVYSCLSEVMPGGEAVYRFFNPVEQTVNLRFVTSQPGQRLLLLDSCDEGACLLTGANGVSCALFPPGVYHVVVDGTDSGPFSFDVGCSQFLAGVDLRVTAIDATALAGSCADFRVSGIAQVGVTNLGTGPAAAPFDLVVYEDRNTTGAYEAAADNLLGAATIMADLAGGDSVLVDVTCAGTVLFRDNVIFAQVDTANVVAEVADDNNVLDTGRACEYRPPIGVFSPTIEWEWLGTPATADATLPDTWEEVDTNPVVGDLNGDGMPEVVFVVGFQQFDQGCLRALRGNDGSAVWLADDPLARVHSSSNPALGDIDGDGLPEVIAPGWTNRDRLIAVDSDGTFLWESVPLVGHPAATQGGGAPAIADIQGDGTPEIVYGANVFRSDGTLFWTPQAGGTVGGNGGDGAISVVLDIDGDTVLEVVAGPTAYRWNSATGVGEILWQNAGVTDGYPAVGNFDDDDLPEIAITSNGTVFLLEGDTGALIWSRQVPRGGGLCTPFQVAGGPPTVADFDGDCLAEIGVAGADLYTVFETDGTVRWSAPIQDCSSHRTASSVFDFDGDGAAEVAFMDEIFLHVFRGFDGTEIVSLPAASHTWTEMITVADVDADNNAEIIMPLNPCTPSPTCVNRANFHGIQVIGDLDDNWVNTRRIWNQHSYHVNNVRDDGSIPSTPNGGTEAPSWRLHNTYRDQLGESIYTAADITMSILSTRVSLAADCTRELCIEAAIGNGGGINVGSAFTAWFYEGDPAAGGVPLGSRVIPDLPPGTFQTLSVCLPFPRFGTVDVHAIADDDGTGRGAVNECREDNNRCVVSVTNSPNPINEPVGIGDALRATGHGSPQAASVTADFDWSLDAGAPRPAGNHFHVMRSDPRQNTSPVAPPFARVSPDPWSSVTYQDGTPRAAATPWVHFFRIVAADSCEQLSPD